MKKCFMTLLLVVVIILTMTACSNSATEPVETTPIEIIVTENTCETTVPDETYETLPKKYEFKIEYYTNSEIEELKAGKLSAYLFAMIDISETETLSVEDMKIIGSNLCDIWYKHSSTFNKDEFYQQSYNIFCNIYEQAVEFRIPLEELYTWTELPVPDVIIKYLSSANFDTPEIVDCKAFQFLNDADAIRVAEVFFANPLMHTNTSIPCIMILSDCNDSVADMAWMHFEELSKNVSPSATLSSESVTSQFCDSLLFTGIDSSNISKIADIAKNILENPYYTFCTKYMYFCNAFYDYDKKLYTDGTISSMAISSLFNVVENADQNTQEQLKELVNYLNYELADKLSSALD